MRRGAREAEVGGGRAEKVAQWDCPTNISGNQPCWSWCVIVLPLLRTLPPTPADPALLPKLASPLARLAPRAPTLVRPLLTLSRQEVLSSKPSCFHVMYSCFFFPNKSCSDCAVASRAEVRPGLCEQPNPPSSRPSSARGAGNHSLVLTLATAPTHLPPLSPCKMGRSSSLPILLSSPPQGGISVERGSKGGLGEEKDQPKGPEKCRLWGRVVSTSWHLRALLGGGFWAALTNSLPRRVPRTPAEPALAFPPLTSTAVAASPGQPGSGLPSKGVPGLGGGGGALQAQVQARQGKRKATWAGEGSEPGQARAGGGWDGGGSRGSGILPSQDPRG